MCFLTRGLIACALVTGLAVPQLTHAAYPEKPVTVVVGFAPGGSNDILARLVSSELQKRLGSSFVVENRPGAASMISANHVKQAEPNGYTLLVVSSGGLTINPAVYAPGRVTYDPLKDFTHIALLAQYPYVLVTGPKMADVKDLKDFIDRAKKAEQPLTHGTASSAMQLVAASFARDAGINITHIPYKGSGPTATDLMGGQTDFAILDTAAVIPLIESGRLKALAVTSKDRAAALKDVPTIAEVAVPDFDATLWTGLVGPAGLPHEVVDTLTKTLNDVLNDPAVTARFHELGMNPSSIRGEAMATTVTSDLERWTAVAQEAGIRIE